MLKLLWKPYFSLHVDCPFFSKIYLCIMENWGFWLAWSLTSLELLSECPSAKPFCWAVVPGRGALLSTSRFLWDFRVWTWLIVSLHVWTRITEKRYSWRKHFQDFNLGNLKNQQSDKINPAHRDPLCWESHSDFLSRLCLEAVLL